MKIFTHPHGYNCHIETHTYGNGRIALTLSAADEQPPEHADVMAGEPIATLTTNMPEIPLGPDEIIVKDYEGNTPQSLINTGIATTVRPIQIGHGTGQIMRLNHSVLKEYTD